MNKRKTDDRRRPERVASRVREELAALMTRDLSDPRLNNVVIARVHATDDLSLVRVGVSALDDDDTQSRARTAVKVLASITSTLRTKLAPKLGMRRVPALEFRVANASDPDARIDSLLAEVSRELSTSAKRAGGGGSGDGQP
jgi:ribosome-binding factor A